MGLITGTNIVVDEFGYGKSTPWLRYIYFLTHYHSDHYGGLTSAFSYGRVYCSTETKELILNKFKNIPDIVGLDINMTHTIYLNEEKTRSVEVTMFDANHVPGSTIILFKGYMGTILHTGDFRFHQSMILKYPLIYPPEKRTKDFAKCAIHIDELIYDNTFCDPIFVFPPREKAAIDAIRIIEKHKGKIFLLGIYTWGKEELLALLAEYFNTKIFVDEDRYKNLKAINFRPELFTTNLNETYLWASRHLDQDKLDDSKLIRIRLTGWVNAQTFSSPDQRSYYIPYSSHSNFEEIQMFVKSVHPCVLRKVVRQESSAEKINRIQSFSSYMRTLMHLRPRGHEIFVKNFTNSSAVSAEYRKCQNPNVLAQIHKELGLKKTPSEIKEYLEKLQESSPRMHTHFKNRSEGKGFWAKKKKVQNTRGENKNKGGRDIVKVKGLKDPAKMLNRSNTLDGMFTATTPQKISHSQRSMSLQEESKTYSENSTIPENEYSPTQNEIDEEEEYEEYEEPTDSMSYRGVDPAAHSFPDDSTLNDLPKEPVLQSDPSRYPDFEDDIIKKKICNELNRMSQEEPIDELIEEYTIDTDI